MHAPVLWEAATMSQSSTSLMCMTSVARSATICPIASPLTVSSSCSKPHTVFTHRHTRSMKKSRGLVTR